MTKNTKKYALFTHVPVLSVVTDAEIDLTMTFPQLSNMACLIHILLGSGTFMQFSLLLDVAGFAKSKDGVDFAPPPPWKLAIPKTVANSSPITCTIGDDEFVIVESDLF